MRSLFFWLTIFFSTQVMAQVTLHDWQYSDPAKYQIFSMTNDILNNMNKSNYNTPANVPISSSYVFDFKIPLFEAIKDKRDSIKQVKAASEARSELIKKGCIIGDCKNGYGAISGNLPGYQYTVTYNGDFSNGLPHGSGRMSYNFVYYIGDFKNGKKEGYGIAEYGSRTNPSRYVGQWINDKRQGDGTLYRSDNIVFSGRWENDKIIQGTAILSDNTVFEGEFEQVRDIHVLGFGTLTYLDGSKQKGYVKGGKVVYEAENKADVPTEYLKAAKPIYELITEKGCFNFDESGQQRKAIANQVIEFEERLKAGADPSENNALHLACIHGRVDMVELLLKYGADPLKASNSSQLPMDHAITPYIGCREQIDEKMRVIELLLRAGTSPDYVTVNGKFPISQGWYYAFGQVATNYPDSIHLAGEWARKLIALGVRFDVPYGYDNKSVLEKCKKEYKALYKILKAEMGL